MAGILHALSQQEQLNFLLTNRIPRRVATRFMGWYSGIESRPLTRASIWLWQQFADDLQLEEASTQDFASLQACFTRQLRDGARPVNTEPDIAVSPCDAIIGEHGSIQGTTVFQAKGFPYELKDLIPDTVLQEKYRDGVFVTLRLKSSMYHRFHAPLDCALSGVRYISGDTWNVNPVALRRVEKLFCRNERAVMDLYTPYRDGGICLVAVAAILVASIRLHCLPGGTDVRAASTEQLDCNATYAKGDELGYFQHGSTIILFATPEYTLRKDLKPGQRIRMGEALLSTRPARARVDPA